MEIDDNLMRQWEPKVQRFASNTYVAGYDRDDIVQELRIAIVKAAQGFEEDRGVLFHTYLHTAMNNTIRTLITKAQRQVLTESLDATFEPLDSDDGPQQRAKILEALADPAEFTQDIELRAILDQARLSGIEEQFVKLRLEGLTMEEITEDLDESAYKVRQGVREKLQEVMHYEQTETEQGRLYSE
tara:strand:- start:2538 stop:3095 length:558 start_codon:yes stop_codon:yes gene_type:complete